MKRKILITVDEDVVTELDYLINEFGLENRSKLINRMMINKVEELKGNIQ